MSREAYEWPRELNRVSVSVPRNIPGEGFTMKADSNFAHDDLHWKEADDPTRAAEWSFGDVT